MPTEGSAARRYDQCDESCTTDCGHCKGEGPPKAAHPSWRERLDTASHLRPLCWLLPAWAKNRICDAWDRELGVFDD